MAMPPDTPIPWMVKEQVAAAGLMVTVSPALVELVDEQLLDRRERGFLVGALGLQLDRRAQARGEHHHAHDALGVHAPALALDPDAALEPGRRLGELRRGPRVQPELVGDRDGALHNRL